MFLILFLFVLFLTFFPSLHELLHTTKTKNTRGELDVLAKTEGGLTGLHLACLNGHGSLVGWLLGVGGVEGLGGEVCFFFFFFFLLFFSFLS